MGRKRFTFLVFSFFLILLNSCMKESETIYKVPEDLQPYIDTFIEEAAIRGHEIEINNLIIEYGTELGSSCGICNETSADMNVQKLIGINPDCTFDYNQQMEALIFHELGHCILGRSHTDEILPNGAFKSMMAYGYFNFYTPCIYAIGEGEECDFTYRRTYYLDELFDESTPIPDWAK